VTGIDLTNIAWFIVKGETTPVDLDELDTAFTRLADKVKDDLMDLYRTRCPLTGREANIIYGFWVKQGICVDPGCRGVTDLFKSYEVARRRGEATISHVPDVRCPHCGGIFDWELKRCTITAGGPQVLGTRPEGKTQPEGKARPEGTRWAFALADAPASCPHCSQPVPPRAQGAKKARNKKVALHVVLDPSTGRFFEVRGKLPAEVTVPFSGETLRPKADAPCTRGGRFQCMHCGRVQRIVESADAHGKPLPFRYYGHYAHTPHVDEENERDAREMGLDTNNQKWFAMVAEADLVKVEEAKAELGRIGDELPIPQQEIYDGYNTNRLVIHGYKHWTDVYGPRQLLALGKLLRAIGEEERTELRDALLAAFQSHLDNASNLCSYQIGRNQLQRVTSGHDYRNPTTICENNIWGMGQGQGPFVNCVAKVREGIEYRELPTVTGPAGEVAVEHDTPLHDWQPSLGSGSAIDQPARPMSLDLIVTDPPYAGSVQYAEMSDWSYVWLHKVLKDVYPDEFGTDITLKSQEIIEDQAMKNADWYFDQLTEAWQECHRVLKDDGLLVFTFHHKEGDRWTGLLRSLFDAGFYLVAAYPTHSEALNSIVIQATGGITYDIIHVCRKREAEPEPIPWTVLRREVQRDARAQLRAIEASGDVLPGPDVWMILLGKALRHFSLHYGQVLDEHGEVLDLDEAMERIRVLVREVRGETVPLPGSLQGIDSLSQVALIHTAGPREWTRDGLHIELRGYTHSRETLVAQGLVAPHPHDKDKLVSVPPIERVRVQGSHLGGMSSPLVDKLHRALAVLDAGQDLRPWLLRWAGDWEPLREALRFLGRRDPSVRELCQMAVRLIEQAGPEPDPTTGRQLGLFRDQA